MRIISFDNRHLSALRIAIVFLLLAAVSQWAKAQTIRGFVLDKNGDAIIGATVIARGTVKGQSTGVDGDFEFNLPKNTRFPVTIDVTFIGYDAKEVILQDASEAKNELVITLFEDKNILNEVVVVGYGQAEKKKLVGSIAKVNGEAVVQQTKDAPIVALQGKTAGAYVVQASGVPGAGSSSILIRGKNSLTSGTEPLYIIDGTPFNGSAESSVGYTSTGVFGLPNALALVNPNDIESIEILKDADATAIYGTRGTNGVVIITTKQGASGKVKVDFDLSASFSKVTKRLDFLSTEEYIDLRKKAVQADLDRGDISQSDLNAYQYPDLYLFDTKTDYGWQDKLLGGTAPAYDANVRISGGNQNTSFLISAGLYDAETTSLGDDKYRRWNAKLSIQHHSLDKRFNISGSASITGLNQDSQSAGSFYSYLNTAPNTPMFNEDGSTYYIEGNSDWVTPLRNLNYESKNRTFNFIGTVDVSYNILKNLTAKVNLGYTYSNSNQNRFYHRDYYNPYDDYYSNYGYYYNTNTNSVNVEPQLLYKQKVSKANINLLAGATFYRTADHVISLSERDYPSDAFLGNASSAATVSGHTNPSHETRMSSLFGRASFDWDGRYIVNAVIRRDGSSRFAPGHQWGTFYSVGGAWIFSDESFIKKSIGDWLSQGKLRVSYGLTGNDKISDYSYMTRYSTSTYPYESNIGLYVNKLGNENLHWEKTGKLDIGLELGFLHDRIATSITYFKNRSSDLLASEYLPTQTGFSAVTSNLDAVVDNKGWEIELNTVNIKTKNFTWTTNFNITVPRNKLVKFDNLENTGYYNSYTIGKSINQVRGYKYLGVDNQTGLPIVEDVNGDGVISSSEDYQYLGTTDPKFYGGLNNTFQYKNFTLDVEFYFRNRSMQYGYLWLYYNPIGMEYNVTRDMANNYWTTPGQDAKYPALTTTSSSDVYQSYYYYLTYSDYAYSSGSFLRLKNISLSYNLPKKALDKLGISNLRLYTQVKNLKTWTNYDSYDPETFSGVPLAREIVFGLNLTF